MPISRRRFLKGSMASVALPVICAGRVLGANDEVRVAVVGCGGRGAGAHVPRMEGQKGVSVVAVCDADRTRMASTAKQIASRYKHEVDQAVDVRKLLERKDVDVVSNATQNYWHSVGTIWACQAGKHSYVEKPVSHYLWAGRQMVNAARKHKVLVQAGTQRRSQRSVRDAIGWVRAGNLGKIQYITAFANKPRGSIGKRKTPLPIPESVDYDLWCGPARKLPLYRNRLHYDCSFVWNTGDGESCNQGVHEIDMARWCLGETELPWRVMSIGDRFVWDDAADVPNTQIIYYDYPTAPILYEVHNMRAAKDSKAMPAFRGQRTGVCVQCEGGWVNLPAGQAFDKAGKRIKSFGGGEDHFQNFIRAVRSGKREELNGDVLEGHLSTAVCHMGNISYRVGKRASRAEMLRQVKGIPVWEEMFNRLVEYLRRHDIDLDKQTAVLGPWLVRKPGAERFHGHEAANRLVRGHYREPFGVPDLSS